VLVNNELEWMRKEAGVSGFQFLSQNLPGETEEDNENPQDSWFAARDSYLALPNTKEVLPSELAR
jgi:hypothetical protein